MQWIKKERIKGGRNKKKEKKGKKKETSRCDATMRQCDKLRWALCMSFEFLRHVWCSGKDTGPGL